MLETAEKFRLHLVLDRRTGCSSDLAWRRGLLGGWSAGIRYRSDCQIAKNTRVTYESENSSMLATQLSDIRASAAGSFSVHALEGMGCASDLQQAHVASEGQQADARNQPWC